MSRSDGIFVVIVVFQERPVETISYKSLMATAEAARGLGRPLQVAVVDNTPGGQDPGPLPGDVLYWPQPENPGLSGAYNRATAMAAEAGFGWLLTLDQDTNLPADFLPKMYAALDRYAAMERVGAIVPKITDGGRMISPFRFVGGWLPAVLTGQAEGVLPRRASAINSGALLRIAMLRELGGYDERFPLHNSDTSLFHRMPEAGWGVAFAANLEVRHALALLAREERMAPERYRKPLADERAFWDAYMGFAGRAERMVRLIGRLCKDLLTRRNLEFCPVTCQEILYRLRSRRKTRLRQWEAAQKAGRRP